MQAAGYEVAQSNAAWLLGGVSPTIYRTPLGCSREWVRLVCVWAARVLRWISVLESLVTYVSTLEPSPKSKSGAFQRPVDTEKETTNRYTVGGGRLVEAAANDALAAGDASACEGLLVRDCETRALRLKIASACVGKTFV